MTKTTQKLAKVLAIHSKGTDPFSKLAWWNLSKVKVTGIDFIVIHQGKGVVTDAYFLKKDKAGNYIMIDEYNKQKSKNPYVEVVFTDGSKRASFVDFTFNPPSKELDALKGLELPKTKQGQAQPLQVFTVDMTTVKIVDPKAKKVEPKKVEPKKPQTRVVKPVPAVKLTGRTTTAQKAAPKAEKKIKAEQRSNGMVVITEE